MRHGPMEELIRWSGDGLTLVLLRETMWPAGCRRVWRAEAKRSEFTAMAFESKRKKDCVEWLDKVARLFNQEPSWLEARASH